MDAKKYLREKVRALPEDIEPAVGRILKKHSGQALAIDRHDLLGAVMMDTGGACDDRQMRRAIQNLRLKGWRICNTIDGSGYFLAANEEEYQAFRAQYGAYAATIWRVLKAMDDQRPPKDLPVSARELQPELFG